MHQSGHYYPSSEFARTRGGAFDLTRFHIAWRFCCHDLSLTRTEIEHLFCHGSTGGSMRYFGKFSFPTSHHYFTSKHICSMLLLQSYSVQVSIFHWMDEEHNGLMMLWLRQHLGLVTTISAIHPLRNSSAASVSQLTVLCSLPHPMALSTSLMVGNARRSHRQLWTLRKQHLKRIRSHAAFYSLLTQLSKKQRTCSESHLLNLTS